MYYVAKWEGEWSVTYGERLQMSPASATDVAWMCGCFHDLLIFPLGIPLEMGNLDNVFFNSNTIAFLILITSCSSSSY